jgi:hypothetical protein
VKTVMVSGRVLVKDGRVQTVDVEEIMARAVALSRAAVDR